MQYYKYGKKETDYLKETDYKLGKEIDRIGIVKREVNPDIFDSLIASIISQQISTKAAFTVKNRLIEQVGRITPETISKQDIENIQLCGMTMRKAKYIKNIAKAAVNKRINLDNLNLLSDKEIINELVKLEGVGEWTAEMLLIHSFERPDVLSYKDLGIRRGLKKLYSLEDISKEEFEVYRKKYSPYNTVASLYLWKISEG
jgi:3-methyladenine DNA glycosylase/8-oxoguanine DNA glycosylase